MRYLFLFLLAPLATAQTIEVVPDGRCNAGVPMPVLDLALPDTAPMPVMPNPEIAPVPMPNLCGDPVAIVLEGGPGESGALQTRPPVRRFGDVQSVLDGRVRIARPPLGLDLEDARERLARELGLPPGGLEDGPLVAPREERP